MAETKNNPEKQPGKAEKPQGPMDETTKTVLGKFDEKEAENVKKIDELFEKKISGSKMAEIALNEVRTMKDQQKQAVRVTFEKFKKQFREKAEENKSERDLLASQLLEAAETEVDARIQKIQVILNMLVKGDYITEEEAAALKRVIVGIEKIDVKEVKVQEILVKLQKNEPLSKEDYDRIVKMVNPMDLTAKDAKPRERFDATTAGILIGYMKPAERYRLVEEMMDSPKAEKTAEVIDGFLRTGILTVAQGEELFREAVQKKIISQEQFEQVYKSRLDKGFYVDEVRQMKAVMDAEVQRMRGRYANNIVDRVVGAPLLGVGMILHSFFWILTNVLASGGNFKSLLKNPYMWAAVGEGALAVEMASGSMKKGAGDFGIGSGVISRAFESFTEREGAKNTVEQNAFKVIGETYLNYRDFGSYLEQGGAETIAAIRKEKVGKGSKGAQLAISFDDLYRAETNKEQQGRLMDAKKNFEQRIAAQINGIAEALTILKIEKQADFNKIIDDYKRAQGLKSGPAAVPSQQPQVVAS